MLSPKTFQCREILNLTVSRCEDLVETTKGFPFNVNYWEHRCPDSYWLHAGFYIRVIAFFFTQCFMYIKYKQSNLVVLLHVIIT